MDSQEELFEAIQRTVNARTARFEMSHEITPGARSEDEFPTLFRSLREDGLAPTAFLALINVLGFIMRLSKKGRRAAASSKFDLAVPPVKSFRALSQLPASVSLDPDGRLRRLRFHYDDRDTQAITLLEFDTADNTDWSRLPRFRSPTRRPWVVRAEPKASRSSD